MYCVHVNLMCRADQLALYVAMEGLGGVITLRPPDRLQDMLDCKYIVVGKDGWLNPDPASVRVRLCKFNV